MTTGGQLRAGISLGQLQVVVMTSQETRPAVAAIIALVLQAIWYKVCSSGERSALVTQAFFLNERCSSVALLRSALVLLA